MDKNKSDDFWEALASDSRLLLKLNRSRNVFDIDEQEADRSCLGTAVNLQADAVQLLLTDFDSDARDYFDLIRALALLAYKNGEGYTYKDPSGRKLFARYMAMRVAALADWALRGNQWTAYLSSMMDHLLLAIEEESGTDYKNRPLDLAIAGPLCLHSLQTGQLDHVAEISVKKKGSASGQKWADLIPILQSILRDKVEFADCYERWFQEHTKEERYNRAYDPSFTASDMVVIAEIRARLIYGVTDPWRVMKSIRWSDLVLA